MPERWLGGVVDACLSDAPEECASGSVQSVGHLNSTVASSPRPQIGACSGGADPSNTPPPDGNEETILPQSPTTFIDSLKLPLETPLLNTPPRLKVARDVDDCWVPRRSDRLAAKSAFRDPQPEKQAKRVLVNKWTRRPEAASRCTPDATIAARFHDTFTAPLSSSKREAMRELFPGRGG